MKPLPLGGIRFGPTTMLARLHPAVATHRPAIYHHSPSDNYLLAHRGSSAPHVYAGWVAPSNFGGHVLSSTIHLQELSPAPEHALLIGAALTLDGTPLPTVFRADGFDGILTLTDTRAGPYLKDLMGHTVVGPFTKLSSQAQEQILNQPVLLHADNSATLCRGLDRLLQDEWRWSLAGFEENFGHALDINNATRLSPEQIMPLAAALSVAKEIGMSRQDLIDYGPRLAQAYQCLAARAQATPETEEEEEEGPLLAPSQVFRDLLTLPPTLLRLCLEHGISPIDHYHYFPAAFIGVPQGHYPSPTPDPYHPSRVRLTGVLPFDHGDHGRLYTQAVEFATDHGWDDEVYAILDFLLSEAQGELDLDDEMLAGAIQDIFDFGPQVIERLFELGLKTIDVSAFLYDFYERYGGDPNCWPTLDLILEGYQGNREYLSQYVTEHYDVVDAAAASSDAFGTDLDEEAMATLLTDAMRRLGFDPRDETEN